MKQIYLDHNSTTPIADSVVAAMQACWAAGYMNPASQHRTGQVARQALEQHRTNIAHLLGAQTVGPSTDQLVFTSGGTESNNLALLGLAQSLRQTRQTRQSTDPSKTGDQARSDRATFQIFISSIEHPSVVGAAEQLARLGFDVRTIPVDQNGVVRLDALENMIENAAGNSDLDRSSSKDSSPHSSSVLLTSIMLANNETGVLQPIQEAAAICRRNGIFFHTDAVQAVAKTPVNFRKLGVDAMSFTAHKLNGPRGIGGLLLRHGVNLHPLLFGGFQQMALRPGTEDVALVAGLLAAIQLYHEQPDRLRPVQKLRDHLQAELLSRVAGSVIVGDQAARVPHTLNVAFPGLDRQAFLLAADFEGLAISTGSACASGSSELSPVLMAMGLPTEVIESSIRISLGVSNTDWEIAESVERIAKIVNRIRGG